MNKRLAMASQNKLKTIAICYEDEQLIAFDKPAGMLVIPSPKGEKRTLVTIVNDAIKGETKLHPCHRLDKDTSGVILFAKGKANQKKMMDCFHGAKVKKNYIAFVHGRLKKRSGEITSKIKSLENRGKPKEALTRYKVVEQLDNYSIVEVRPVTGRTNQIRIHFAKLGCPLVGERKYAMAKSYSLKFRRVALHSASLEFKHPITQNKINIQSNLPKDMEVFRGKYGN